MDYCWPKKSPYHKDKQVIYLFKLKVPVPTEDLGVLMHTFSSNSFLRLFKNTHIRLVSGYDQDPNGKKYFRDIIHQQAALSFSTRISIYKHYHGVCTHSD